MLFTNPWGLLAFLSLPAILGLHFFRSRRHVRRIGGLHLWRFAETRLPVGGRFERLVRNLPLLFQLLAAAAASLLIAGIDLPRPVASKHYTVILDDSASMQAGPGRSARDQARERLLAWARPDDRFTLIAAGARAGVLAGPFATHGEFAAALEKWRPEEGGADLEAALNLAARFAAGTQRILLATDSADAARGSEASVETAAFGAAADNVAIAFADRVRESAPAAGARRDRVFAVVEAFSALEKRTTLRARAGGAECFKRELALEPGKPLQVEFEIPATDEAVELAIDADALAADNRVLLAPPMSKEVRVALAGLDPAAAGHFRRAAEAVAETRMVEVGEKNGNGADLVFASGKDSAAPAGATRLCLLPASDDPASATARVVLGRDILADARSRVVESLPLEGVIWAHAAPTPEPPARILLAHGGVPLLDYAEPPGGHGTGVYRLNLLTDRTNLFQTTAWPVLMQALVEECRDALPGLGRTNYRAGEEVVLHLAPAPGLPPDFRLTRDGVLRRRFDALPQVEPGLPAGEYAVAQGEKTLARFAVNLFAPGESDLRARSARDADLARLEPDAMRETETNQALYYALLTLALLTAVLSWIFFDISR